MKYLDYVYIDESMRTQAEDTKYTADFVVGNESKDAGKKDENTEDIDDINIMLAKMNLNNYDKYLLSGNEDLTHLLNIKAAFEDSVQKFNESMKGTLEQIRFTLGEKLREKRILVQQFDGAYALMLKENEEESQKLMGIYFHSKKQLTRYIEETQSKDKKEIILDILN